MYSVLMPLQKRASLKKIHSVITSGDAAETKWHLKKNQMVSTEQYYLCFFFEKREKIM